MIMDEITEGSGSYCEYSLIRNTPLFGVFFAGDELTGADFQL